VDVPESTITGLESHAAGRIALRLRRGFLLLLLLLVVAGVTGALGVLTTTSSATTGDWTLSLSYPRVARAGLDTTWEVRVTHPGGFSKPITLAVSRDYFDIFETQGFHPDASSSTQDGRTLYLTFDPPPSGDVFVVDFDAYIQPSSQVGRGATVAVVDHTAAGPVPLVSLDYHTWLVP